MTYLTLYADNMQMTITAANLHSQLLRIPSQLLSASDALHHYLYLHLDLQHVLLLRATCRIWRQLITPVHLHQLSARSHRLLLSDGLDSDWPLLELVEQQAQLLMRLRGKQSFTPGIQRLSFDHPANGANAYQGRARHEKPLHFKNLVWSPCSSLEDPSRWLALYPASQSPSPPVLVDTANGQQLKLQAHGHDCVTEPAVSQCAQDMHASWLSDKQHLLLHPSPLASPSACNPSDMSLADLHDQTTSSVRLPGARCPGRSHFLTVSREDSFLKDILCWIAKQGMNESFRDHISVYELPSCLLLYQLACPEQMIHDFLKTRITNISPAQRSPAGKDWQVRSYRVVLDPCRQYLTFLWVFFLLEDRGQLISGAGSQGEGVSIHSAMSGELQHSMLLTADEGGSLDWEPQLTWLPGSSNFVCLLTNGLLLCMTVSGEKLWSVRWSDRVHGLNGDDGAALSHNSFHAQLSVSPCGRWILVTDRGPEFSAVWGEKSNGRSTGQLNIVEASKGSILHCHESQQCFHSDFISWSQAGEACLVEDLAVVFAAFPTQDPMQPQVFRELQLLGRCTGALAALDTDAFNDLDMSPSGSTVIGVLKEAWMEGSITSLQHWQLHPASPAVPTSDDPQPSGTVQPSSRAALSWDEHSAWELAWHPLPSACICAVVDLEGGVHLIDARANRCIRSWSEAELHCPGTRPEHAQWPSGSVQDGEADKTGSDGCRNSCDGASLEDRVDSRPGHEQPVGQSGVPDSDDEPASEEDVANPDWDDSDDASSGGWPLVLIWSRDGRRLAVASGANCCVLHFSDSFI